MIRFYNGRVLAFAPETEICEREVWTDGGSICYVGKTPDTLITMCGAGLKSDH